MKTSEVDMLEKDCFEINVPNHLKDLLPLDNVIIDFIDSISSKAISHILRQDIIGVSLEGCSIGRHSKLDWLCISTSSTTFLFDIQTLGRDIFTAGLKDILESKRIVKVIHDCRLPSDNLLHCYGTKLDKVYDTQLAEYFASVQESKVHRRVKCLNDCLSFYLKVPEDCLPRSVVNRGSSEMRHSLTNSCIYLRLLKKEFDLKLRVPFRRCVDVYLQSVQKMSDQELLLSPPDLRVVPSDMVLESMQVLNISEQLVKSVNSPRLVEHGSDDPYIRYQRDCQRYKNVGICENNSIDYECNDDVANPYVNDRSDIVRFLIEKMYACGNSGRGSVTSAPLENASDLDSDMSPDDLEPQDSCSVASFAAGRGSRFSGDFSERSLEGKSPSLPVNSKCSIMRDTVKTIRNIDGVIAKERSSKSDPCSKSNANLIKLKMIYQNIYKKSKSDSLVSTHNSNITNVSSAANKGRLENEKISLKVSSLRSDSSNASTNVLLSRLKMLQQRAKSSKDSNSSKLPAHSNLDSSKENYERSSDLCKRDSFRTEGGLLSENKCDQETNLKCDALRDNVNSTSTSSSQPDPEDVWATLRNAFAELGPQKPPSKPIFVPSGMQC